MQGSQELKTYAGLKCGSVWFKTKLVSQFFTFSFLICNPFFLPYLHATPAGGQVVGGTASISQSDLTTTINQTSQNLAVNWQSFDVNVNEKVNFVQPNSSSIALNRILGNNGSTIQGQINANGNVILVNPNGVFFTPTSTINVGGLVTSSLDMTPADFMNGNYIFNEVAGANGSVINSGIINASLGGNSSTGGNVALIGKQVKNEGLISATLGSVILASGKQAVLTFDSAGLMGITVTKEVLQTEVGLEEAVINSGSINASGGRVLLTASTSQDVFSQAVNNGSLDQATSVVVNDDGSFALGGGADVLNTGSIDVSSETNENNTARIVLLGENITSSGSINADVNNGNAGEIEIHANDKVLLTKESITSAKALNSGVGGLVKVLGDKVGLFDNSIIDASGFNGGGQVLFGGDQEGKNPLIRNASFIYLGEATEINSDATSAGDGGKVIVFATDSARVHGIIFARGGINGGNGGFIETSGLRGFDITSVPDASAYVGENGTWLIDPYNITISASATRSVNTDTSFSYFDAIQSDARVNVNNIKTGLINGDVIIRTTRTDGLTPEGTDNGDITIEADIDFDGVNNGLATLTLDADRNITLNSAIKIYDSTSAGNGDQLNLNLFARGDVLLNTGSSIITHGANVTIGDTNNNIIPTNFVNNGTINTTGGNNQDGGAITITVSSTDPLQGSITSSGNLIANGGTSNRGGGSNPGINGFNAGAITLRSAGAIDISGNIESIGSQADYRAQDDTGRDGGLGGNVSIISSAGDVIISGYVKTTGGLADGDNTDTGNNADPGNGGNGGFIDIESTVGSVSVGLLESNGGNAIGADDFPLDAGVYAKGGDAGTISLTSGSTGSVTLTNNISANGGAKGDHVNSLVGDGNAILVDGNTIINNTITLSATGTTNGDITFNGTTLATGDRAEDLTLTGKDINFAGDVGSTTNRFKDIKITSTGNVKAETSPAIIDRKDIYSDTLNVIQSVNFTSRNINADAVANMATNFAVGNNTVIINSDNAINVGDILTNGGAADVASAGHAGGGIDLSAEDITVGSLNSSGSDAEATAITASGGAAGIITLAATDTNTGGTPTITLNGNINSSGGSATTGGTDGASEDVNSSLTVDATGTGTFTVNYTNDFTSNIIATGSAGTDTIIAANRDNTWVMTGANAGTLNKELPVTASSAPGLAFTNFEAITGNSNTDTLSGRAVNNSWSVSGNGVGRLTNADIPAEFIDFTNINSLVGSTANDDFTIAATGSLSGSISDTGTTDTNTFTIQATTDATWDIDQANGGTLTNTILGSGFTNIHQIYSGGGDDTITVRATGSIRDIIDGGGNRTTTGDSLNLSALTNVDVVLGNSAAITPSTTDLNVNAIETITGNNDGTSSANTNSAKITGESGRDNSWNLTGLNSGTVDSSSTNVTFVDFTDVTGGDQNDTFTIGALGQLKKGNGITLINGVVNGAAHTTTPPLSASNPGDVLDLAGRTNILLNINSTSGNTLNYDGPSIDFKNIETIQGNGTSSTVQGENAASTWTINELNSGFVRNNSTLATTYFLGFNNLTGGDQQDSFRIVQNATGTADGLINGLIDGGSTSTNDQISVISPQGNVNIALGSTLVSNATNIVNVETVTGDNANTTLIGEDLSAESTVTETTWNITGSNDGNVNYSNGRSVSFMNVNNLTGSSGVDKFIFDNQVALVPSSPTNVYITGLINGGDQPTNGGDSVIMSALTGSFTVTLEEDITGIESVTGNNNSMLRGAPVTALSPALINWDLTGPNDGNVTYINTASENVTVNFTDFKDFTGRDNVDDVFKISSGGSYTGSITGGAGSGIDSVDYSSSTGVTTVEVGNPSNGIAEIEQVIGDNANIVLKGFQGNNIRNFWIIDDDASNILKDGFNDGTVTYNDGSGNKMLSFVNFARLEAGNAGAGNNGDSFIINSNGNFSGSITGGNANDTIDINLAGSQVGTIFFNGVSGLDSLSLNGDSDGVGGTDYTGVYTSNIDVNTVKYDQLSYTNPTNSTQYTVNYRNIDSLQDNLIAASLTVNGTNGRDDITLTGNSFTVDTFTPAVNNALLVNYANKNSLSVDALNNNNDRIIVNSPVNVNGVLSLKAETIVLPNPATYAGALLTANELVLDSIVNTNTTTADRLEIDVASLNIQNTGNVYVNDISGTVDFTGINTVSIVDLTAQNGISSVSDLTSTNLITLNTAAGDISLTGNNNLTGQLDLSTNTVSDISLINQATVKLGDIFTRNLAITTTGVAADISQTASSSITSTGLTTLTSTGNISLQNDVTGINVNNFTNLAIASAQSAAIVELDDIGFASLNASSIDINAKGEITDVNANNPGDNITATSLKLVAGTGIGNGNALETQVSQLDLRTGSGTINIDNVGNLTNTNIVNTGTGGISLLNQGNVEISNIDAGYGTKGSTTGGGNLNMIVVGGSVTGIAGKAYTVIPDITAYNADITVAGGTFGSAGRPISVYVNNQFDLFSLQSAVKYIAEPNIKNDTSTAKISITDAFSSFAGQQLIEVESIGDIDPAIFTDVRNYSNSDIALMMPADQRYTDEEDDDEDAKRKRQQFLNTNKQ